MSLRSLCRDDDIALLMAEQLGGLATQSHATNMFEHVYPIHSHAPPRDDDTMLLAVEQLASQYFRKN